MKKIIIALVLSVPVPILGQQLHAPLYCNDKAQPCINMNAYGAYYGQIVNVSSGVWALGYGQLQGTNGTSALTWSNAGAVTVPAGTITVSTSATSSLGMCFAGAFQSLPTSGYNEGCLAYQKSDHTLYVSSQTVSTATSWKAVW